MTALTDDTGRLTERRARPWARILCAAAAAAAVVPFALSALTGDSGALITEGLLRDGTVLTATSVVAALVAAALFVAAVRLGRAVGGEVGTVVTASGAAVALMYAGYYAVFGAGAVVAGQMLSAPGDGLGEAAALLLNAMELTRYAPGLALVGAVAVAGRTLPRWVRVTAGVLVVLTLLPFTSWVAALLVPVWLGATAASVRT